MATDGDGSGKEKGHGDSENRALTNVYLLVFFLLLVGIGVWLADALVTARKADDCIASGRRNCTPIEVPIRESRAVNSPMAPKTTNAARSSRAASMKHDQAIERGRSANLEVLCRLLAPVRHHFVLDVLTFIERAQAGALHCRNVNEHVARAVVRLNEAVTLGRVEPLDFSASHEGLLACVIICVGLTRTPSLRASNLVTANPIHDRAQQDGRNLVAAKS